MSKSMGELVFQLVVPTLLSMNENPFHSPSSQPSSVQEASHRVWNSSLLNQLFHGSHVGLRILRTLVYAVLPLPIMLAAFFVITDLFYFNHHDSEFLRLSESYEAGYLLFDFLFYLVLGGFCLTTPLLAFSSVIEFLCKKLTTRVLAGIGFGVFVSTLVAVTFGFAGSFDFNFASKWELVEACVNFLNPIVVLVGISLFASLFPGNTNHPSNEPV